MDHYYRRTSNAETPYNDGLGIAMWADAEGRHELCATTYGEHEHHTTNEGAVWIGDIAADIAGVLRAEARWYADVPVAEIIAGLNPGAIIDSAEEWDVICDEPDAHNAVYELLIARNITKIETYDGMLTITE